MENTANRKDGDFKALIAAIETAKPGIFECEELRCPNAEKINWWDVEDSTGNVGDGKIIGWHCSDDCPICHGKLFKPPDLEWVLEWLEANDITEVDFDFSSGYGKTYQIRYYQKGSTLTDRIIFDKKPTPLFAALHVLLAVLKEEGK